MKMKLRTVILTLAAVAAMAACKSQFETLLSSNDVDAKYKAAMELFNNKKYLKAGQLFESMAILTDGTERSQQSLHGRGPFPPPGLPVPGHPPLGVGPDAHPELPGLHHGVRDRVSLER